MCGIERKFIQSLAAGENVFEHSFKVDKDYNKARKCNTWCASVLNWLL